MECWCKLVTDVIGQEWVASSEFVAHSENGQRNSLWRETSTLALAEHAVKSSPGVWSSQMIFLIVRIVEEHAAGTPNWPLAFNSVPTMSFSSLLSLRPVR